ncbi:MAG TPA: C69 family dipeptidase [Candidatus Saccharicenans sp.]|nr:C69 family dipeptidase [Candidatus Saccharicenans sp.]
MKAHRKIISIFILVFIFLVAAGLGVNALNQADPDRDQFNCYTILVGKKASADGSVMIAHNEDDYGEIIVNVRKMAPKNYGQKVKINLGQGGVYETSGQVNGFLWIEATEQEFADSFINDQGVVITSNSCPSREEGEDFTAGGIGYMLRRIVAEKAGSAREAVKLAGELIEKYGYRSSGRTYSIADKNEAWMLAVIKGRHWLAQRVPDNAVAVIPNFYTIRQIRLDDPDNFLGSPDLIEYARKNGWYDEKRDGPFDFKKVFNRPTKREPVFDGNTLRMWRGLSLLSGQKWEITDDFPFSFEPANPITVEKLMSVLRDHYEGTEYDATDGYKLGSPNKTKFRTICTSSTINSFVVCLNKQKPEPISALTWLAFGKPDTTLYLPLYSGLETLPPGAGSGPNHHDYELLYQQHFDPVDIKAASHELLSTRVRQYENLVEANYGQMIELVRKNFWSVEEEYLKTSREFENKFSTLYTRDKKAAQKLLTDYELNIFQKIIGLYDKLLEENRPAVAAPASET